MNSGLDEIFLRIQIKKILKESDGMAGLSFGDIMPPTNEQFYETFIGPFVDIFKVATVAAKDVTAATLTTIKSMMTFDTTKQQQLMQEFRSDRQKYDGQMKEAMASTEAALSSPDAHLMMMMMDPVGYLALGVGKKAVNTAEPVTDFVGRSFEGLGMALGVDPGAGSGPTEKGPLRGLLDDMKVLFFGEGLDEIDELEKVLLEGEEVKPPTEDEAQRAIEDWLEETGAAEVIEKQANEILAAKEKEVKFIEEQYRTRLDLLDQLTQAKTFEEINALVPKLAQEGMDLQQEVQKLQVEAEKQIEEIKAGGKEAEKILEDLKKHPDASAIPQDAPVDAYFPLIEQGLIAVTFADVVTEGKKQGVGELLGFVAEMTRPELMELSGTGTLGKQYADLILGLENSLMTMQPSA